VGPNPLTGKGIMFSPIHACRVAFGDPINTNQILRRICRVRRRGGAIWCVRIRPLLPNAPV